MSNQPTTRDLNALSARALSQGRSGRYTVALVAYARGEATPEQVALVESTGCWSPKSAMAECAELIRRGE